jgi:putative tryptophan/tyrosine transport system substrate-binding protein
MEEKKGVAFANLSERHVDALLVSQSQLFSDRKVQIATLAARDMMPTMFTDISFPASGGLMSYGPSYPALVRQVGVYVGLILKGEKPADLPVMRPRRHEIRRRHRRGGQRPPGSIVRAGCPS